MTRVALRQLVCVIAFSGTSAIAGQPAESESAPVEIVLYPAVAMVGDTVPIEGRVVEREQRSPATGEDGKRRNLKRNLKLLSNDELANVEVALSLTSAAEVHTISDKEGYFRAELPSGSLPAGRHTVQAVSGRAESAGQVLLVPVEARAGIVSDADDTLLITEVSRKRLMLKNTLLRNPAQRRAVPGMPELLSSLSGGAQTADCCVFYLSGTPRQLHSSVQTFLDLNGFPHGVLVTNRVTNDRSGESLRDQRAYKLARLSELLTRLPSLSFTLFGDDAELDPEIYAQIERQFPGRIRAGWIRRVSPDSQRALLDGLGDLATLLATSTPTAR
jgi:phosphatidate phosphatase APP1